MSTALDDLRAENAALVARVSALEARERDRTASVERSAPLGGVVAPVRRELQITYLPPDPGQFVMPTEEELRQLLPIVLDQHPELRPNLGRHSLSGDPEADYFAEFCAAFRRIGFLGRLDAPNRKFYLDHWIDEASEWLRLQRMPADMSAAPYLAAVMAHGDVCFTPADNTGHVWEVGLAPWGGRPAGVAWRDVLATGKLLAPTHGRYGQPGPRAEVRFG